MTTSDPSKKLHALLKRLRTTYGSAPDNAFTPHLAPDDFGPLLHQFIDAMLLFDAGRSQAANAAKRLREAVVDLNELRICFSEELAALLGERYPRGKERAQRLKAALTEIYRREHSLSLQRLADMSKRDARAYLETLDGVPSYAAHRVLLVGLGAHCIPCDERLHALLEDEKAIEENLTIEEASSWLEHQVKAGEALDAHYQLQCWSEDNTPSARPSRKEKGSLSLPPTALKSSSKPAAKSSKPRAEKPSRGKSDGKPESKREPKGEKSKSAR